MNERTAGSLPQRGVVEVVAHSGVIWPAAHQLVHRCYLWWVVQPVLIVPNCSVAYCAAHTMFQMNRPVNTLLVFFCS